MPPTLHIRLLGGFDLAWQGRRPHSFDSSRTESLLAYLLLNPSPQSRRHLAFLLWPDSTESQALTNLRHQLHLLRRELPDPDHFVEVTRRTLRWRPGSPCRLDTEELVSMTGADGAPPRLSELLELYRGDLLPGSYDEWLGPHRERLRGQFLGLLERSAGAAAQQGHTGEAILATEHLLRFEPVREESYRRLMELQFEAGDRAATLEVFDRCTKVLRRELGVEPSSETVRLKQLLAGRRHAPGSPAGEAATVLVGRRGPWKLLTGAWQEAGGRHSRMALITGEAGIGKSRLIDELAAWCAGSGATVAVARSYPAEGSLAFGLVAGWLRSPAYAAQLARADRTTRRELSRLLPELREASELPEFDSAGQLPLFDAMARTLLARGAPILLVAEDLHWADRPSLQFIHYLARLPSHGKTLVAGTARLEELDEGHPLHELAPSLRSRGQLVEVELERLTPEATRTLAEQVSGRPLSPEEAGLMFAESEGNPLFVVEGVRAGIPDLKASGPIGGRVRGLIELRLSQLSDAARALLGVASAVGREFPVALLRDAPAGPSGDPTAQIDELWRRQVIRERGPEVYDFSHDKIREVVYRNLSPAMRLSHHRHIARRLEAIHERNPQEGSHRIATHYDLGDLHEKAALWYERAAGEAMAAHADEGALRLLERGLHLASAISDPFEQAEQELSLLLASLAPLSLHTGSGSPRVQAAQRRAMALCDQLGRESPPTLVRSAALTGLSLGNFEEARRLGSELGQRGGRLGDRVLQVESAYLLGISAFWKGELAAARSHFERAVEGYRPEHHLTHRVWYGLDPKVVCLSRLGNTLWFLGYPKQARDAADLALSAAYELGHAASLATAIVFSCFLEVDDQNRPMLRQKAALLRDPSVHGGSLATRISSAAFSGYLEVLDGRPGMGIGIIRRALEESSRLWITPGFGASIRRLLLDALAIAPQEGDGLATAEEALEFPDGARLWEPELRRLKAQLLSATGEEPSAAESELERSLAVARRQGAVMPAIRTANALLEHRLVHGGDLLPVRAALEDALAEVEKGADSSDLARARSFLEKI